MYSGAMTVLIVSEYGTGFAGSLTYSSKASAAGSRGDSVASRDPAARYSSNGRAPFGGQLSCLRHSFVPVSNANTFGSFGSPFPLRWKLKKGNSTFSRKYSAVFDPKETGPSEAPLLLFQPP